MMQPKEGQRDQSLAASAWSRLAAARQGLRVSWRRSWDDELHAALQELPESPDCPHELYRLLIENPSGAPKRIALVFRGNECVAVAGVRQRAHDWVPVTHYLVPGFIFPHRPGYLGPALAALGLDVAVGWWRMETPPPAVPGMRHLERVPTYGASLQGDWESHWRQARHAGRVQRTRKKCEGLAFRVNHPGDVEWAVRQWEIKWRVNPAVERADLADRFAVVRYLERTGRHFTLALADQGMPVAANTFIKHGTDLVWQYTYRSPEYDQRGVGNRVMDLGFQWGANQGFDTMDLGGDYPEHKKRWAPAAGAKFSFSVCPAGLYQLKQSRAAVAAIREKGVAGLAQAVRRQLARLTGREPHPTSP